MRIRTLIYDGAWRKSCADRCRKKNKVCRFTAILAFFFGACLPASNLAAQKKSVSKGCNSITQQIAFGHSIADALKEGEHKTDPRVLTLWLKTSDGVKLHGLRFPCTLPAGEKQCHGTILFGIGDGDLASQDINDTMPFVDGGWTTVMYDYRGYGKSEGRPDALHIISDFREIIQDELGNRPQHLVLYGGAFGGIIAINAIEPPTNYDLLVLDGVPSELPTMLLCSSHLFPVNRVPNDASKLLIISGTIDKVVPPTQMEDLIYVARPKRATIWETKPFTHIWDDEAENKVHFQTVLEFLRLRF